MLPLVAPPVVQYNTNDLQYLFLMKESLEKVYTRAGFDNGYPLPSHFRDVSDHGLCLSYSPHQPVQPRMVLNAFLRPLDVVDTCKFTPTLNKLLLDLAKRGFHDC